MVTKIIKRNLVCDNFEGTLYYIQLDSQSLRELCLVEIEGDLFVLKENEEAFGFYNELLEKYDRGILDLFLLWNSLLLKWLIP
jgi:hypothetical protein